MAKVIFRLNLQGKTPSTWAIPQSNVMAPKDNKGNKFIDYLDPKVNSNLNKRNNQVLWSKKDLTNLSNKRKISIIQN